MIEVGDSVRLKGGKRIARVIGVVAYRPNQLRQRTIILSKKLGLHRTWHEDKVERYPLARPINA